MELYTYHRSVAAQRVRIALNLKGVAYESRFVDLSTQREEQNHPRFRELNPQGLAPVLVDDGVVITQSLAIIEYLDERIRVRPLLPEEPLARARVRSLAQLFASDMQPLTNLRVFDYLREQMGCETAQLDAWYEHWTMEGLEAAETLLSRSGHTGGFCFGEQPTLADVCMVPQVHDATLRGYDLSGFPVLRGIYRNCMTLASFQAAAPETQPDAVEQSRTVAV